MDTYLIIGALGMEVSGLLSLFKVNRKSKIGRIAVYECTHKGADILVAKTGMGEENSRAAARNLKNISANRLIKCAIIIGVCGALDPMLNEGEVVAYKKIKNLDTRKGKFVCTGSLPLESREGLNCRKVEGATLSLLADSREMKAELHKNFGVQAVDMESYYICRQAAAENIPFMVIRTVSDTAEQSLPPFMADFSRGKKFIGSLGLIKYVTRPSRAKELWHTLKNTRTAAVNLTEAVRKLVLH